MCCGRELTVVAGDDITIAVDFRENGKPFEFSSDTKAIMILHHKDRDEEIKACEYDGGTAKFYLSGKDTLRLEQDNPYGEYSFCIKVVFHNGAVNTPIHRYLLYIERC